MTLLALAGKWPGRAASGFASAAAAAGAGPRRASEARAIEPIPRPQRSKKWRRVRSSSGSGAGMARGSSVGLVGSFAGDELVQVQQDPGHGRPGLAARGRTGGRRPAGAASRRDSPSAGRRARARRNARASRPASSAGPSRRTRAARARANSMIGRVVEQGQGLERRVRPHPAGAGPGGVGGVEDDEGRVGRGPPEVGVEAPAEAVGPVARRPSRGGPGPATSRRRAGAGRRSGRRRSGSAGRWPTSAASRISSASSRSRDCRASRRFSGSTRARSGRTRDAWR